MTMLKLAEGLALPLEAVTEKLGFLGRTGSGKTYAALKLAEEMYRVGAQFVAIDPVGKWWSLRLAANGKDPGLVIPVFGGLQGDIPIEPGGGKLLADVIVDRGVSAVLDVSQFESDAAKARFAADFADRLFFRKKATPTALHLFIEEAQEFVPQNPQRDEARMLHVWTRIQKLGRNFGIGTSLLSQRPQEVNKKCLNQTELLFVFQLTGPQERKAIAGWISEKGIDADIEAELPKLARGRPHAWSPAWLKISKVITIAARTTFDASSTPKVGARTAERSLAPIDLVKLRTDMAATIERAKAEDPRELRRQLAERDRELRELRKVNAVHAGVQGAAKSIEKRVEVPVLKEGQVKRLETVALGLGKLGERFTVLGSQIVSAAVDVTEALGKFSRNGPPMSRPVSASTARPITTYQPRDRSAVPARVRSSRRAAEGEFRLRAGARRMLEALARRFPAPTTAAQMGQLAAIATSGGTFSTYLSDLRGAGYLTETRDGLELTEAGWESIGQRPGALSAQTTDEMLQLYSGILRGGARRMIDELVRVSPHRLSRTELGARAHVADSGGTFSTYLSDLNRAGLVDVGRDDVGASELLMDPAGASR